MYLVLSAFTSSPISFVATTKASAFSFTVYTLPLKIYNAGRNWQLIPADNFSA
jgi:hypothetical protein